MQFYRTPLNFTFDFDRYRRDLHTVYYGNYKPMPLKRLMCWVMNERITPVDWEEVPPFDEKNEQETSLIAPREATYHPFECVTQPDMLTRKQIYIRRLVFLGAVILGMRYVNLHPEKFRHIPFFWQFYFARTTYRVLSVGWLYYLFSRIYIDRDYQLPYN